MRSCFHCMNFDFYGNKDKWEFACIEEKFILNNEHIDKNKYLSGYELKKIFQLAEDCDCYREES